MKKKHVPFLLLSVVLSLFLLSRLLYRQLDTKGEDTHEFTFQLPFPADIVERYSLTNQLRIDRVYITGPFATWKADDEDLRMYWKDEKTWSIHMFVPPGTTQYKYVVHTKDPVFDKKDNEWRRQIWVQDRVGQRTPDGFGGWNSVINLPDIRAWKRATDTALLGLGVLLILYILLKPVIHHFIHLKISYRFKLVLITGLLLVVSNILYITYNIIEMRFLSRETYIDETQFLLRPLTSRMDASLSLRNLDKSAIKAEIDVLFRDSTDRNEKNKYHSGQFRIPLMLILDIHLDTWLLSAWPQALKKENLALARTSYTQVQDFLRDHQLKSILEGLRTGRYSPVGPSFVLRRAYHDPDRPQVIELSRLLSGYDTLIVPLRSRRTLYGYGIFFLHTDLLGLEIGRVILFNILMMLFILILMYFLLNDLGGILSMEEEARTDGLTGTFNRRTLDQILQQEIRRERREQIPLGLIILDLDHFKDINDEIGHLAGDRVLKETARVIESCIRRPADELGRYGGEEFCVILPHTDLEGVIKVAECIRSRLESKEYTIEGKTFQVQASLGCYAAVPQPDSCLEDYYKRADHALYQAKHQGRNRVVAWEQDPA